MSSSSVFRWLQRTGVRLFGLLLAAVVLLVNHVMEREIDARFEPYVAVAAPHVDAYCAVQKRAAAHPFFATERRYTDAATLLNARLPWIGADDGRNPPLSLPAALRTEVSQWGDEWLSPKPIPSLDYSWMAAAKAFDVWRLWTDGPLAGDAPVDPFRAPLPDFGVLTAWAKLRFVHAAATGTTAQAAEEIRHLAWLSWSTSTTTGANEAARLLKVERQAWEQLNRAGLRTVWEPVSAEFVRQVEVLSRGATLFRLSVLPRPDVDKLLSCGSAVTRCPLLMDEAVYTTMRFALEDGDDGRAAAVKQALERGVRSCDARLNDRFDRWFFKNGALRDEALDRLSAQTGAIGRVASLTGLQPARDWVSAVRLSEFLPRAQQFQELFAQR